MKEYIKDFDTWNERKKKVDSTDFNSPVYFKEREVWWATIGVNIGVEIDGKNDLFERPVLVFRKLNAKQFYGLPLTSKGHSGPFYSAVTYNGAEGSACLSQLKVFSTKRLLRKIGTIPQKEFAGLQDLFSKFFKGERF